MNKAISINQHEVENRRNLDCWNAKPLLRRIYRDFHRKIGALTLPETYGITIELGSGIGNIKDVLPHCLRTDLFPNPWNDQIESAYQLSFKDSSVANIILFDVFHHLRYPGNAFAEFNRVLIPGGRVIIFDPCLSLLGLLVYGAVHHEPVALFDPISWNAPPGWSPQNESYYAAQGNAYRIFWGGKNNSSLTDWEVIYKKRFSAISYVASGGYRKPQFYPDCAYGLLRCVDWIGDLLPQIFATRLLVGLKKIK